MEGQSGKYLATRCGCLTTVQTLTLPYLVVVQAYFGAAPISAPFGDTYGTTGAGVWEKLNPTEKGIFERILKSTVTSLEDVDKLVSNQSWQLAGDRLRNSMYETRKAMLRITEANGSEVRCATSLSSLSGKLESGVA